MVAVNKYQDWEGIPILDDHSKMKHKIYLEYITAYVQTLMSKVMIPRMEFFLVDGFCGGGIYKDAISNTFYDGSPLLMIEAVNQARVLINVERKKKRQVIANYWFLDKNKGAIDTLTKQLQIKKQANFHYKEDIDKAIVRQGTFDEQIGHIISHIKTTKSGEKALFFLDQYGYSDVKIPHIKTIIKPTKKI